MKQNTQQGSAHVVIVIVLVIALVGALGYIFYQNLAGKKDQKQQSASSSQQAPPSTTDKTDTVDTSNTDVTDSNANGDTTSNTVPEKTEKPSGQPDDGYFAIAPWKIQVKEAEGVYAYWNIDGDMTYFTSKAVKAIGGYCANSEYSLVSLTRARTSSLSDGIHNSMTPVNSKAINGYYYYRGGANGTCSEKGLDVQAHDRQSLYQAVATIKVLN